VGALLILFLFLVFIVGWQQRHCPLATALAAALATALATALAAALATALGTPHATAFVEALSRARPTDSSAFEGPYARAHPCPIPVAHQLHHV
jgi:hypothetical protein